MPTYSQATRPMRVDTVLGEDVLLLAGLHAVEAVSEPYEYHLELLSEDPAIEVEQLPRSPVLITVQLPDGEERKIHGLISRFYQFGQRDELTTYRAEVVPWLWFLSLSHDCKVFQNLTVLEIVEEVFRSQGYSDFKFRCAKGYPKREFCVQYRETHLNFVSRLLEEEGIFYFFEHSDSMHTLVLADDKSAFQSCPGAALYRMASSAEPGEDVVTEFYQEYAAYIGKVTLKDYDPLQPSLKLESSIAGEGKEEVYDYHPGRFTSLEEGERYARLQLEAAEAVRRTVRGKSTCRALQAGCTFELTDHYRGDLNRKYTVLNVQHFASTGDYRAWETAPMDFENHFLAIPSDVPYHPPRRSPKPVVRGSQTALVVGPPGEEVYTDKHGRVKVQFYWDRLGKKNDQSSCWVRVATPWGGKGYGGVSIPRIGNEVLVDFLEGDPDRPLIVASVYNAEQTPPFGLPGAGIQMGMKSRSSPGGGGFNEITMTDTAGTEQITIHGQYDMATTVQHDQTNTINHDQSTTVANDQANSIGNNQSTTIKTNRSTKVGVDDGLTVGANREMKVGANLTESVGGAMSETVTGTKLEDVKASKTLNIGTLYSVTVGAAMTENVAAAKMEDVGAAKVVSVAGMSMEQVGAGKSVSAAKITEEAKGKFVAKAGGKMDLAAKANLTIDGKKVIINAKSEIVLKCGSASITLKSGGDIIINGKNITAKGSGKVKIVGSSIEEN